MATDREKAAAEYGMQYEKLVVGTSFALLSPCQSTHGCRPNLTNFVDRCSLPAAESHGYRVAHVAGIDERKQPSRSVVRYFGLSMAVSALLEGGVHAGVFQTSIAPLQLRAFLSADGLVATCGNLFTPAQTEVLKALPAANRGEVWHVGIRALKCFVMPVPGGHQFEPRRPRALIIDCCQPGAILACRGISIDEEPLSVTAVVNELGRCMIRPKIPNMPIRRPDVVIFEDPELASACALSLGAIGLLSACVRRPPPLGKFILNLSQALLTTTAQFQTQTDPEFTAKCCFRAFELNMRPGLLQLQGTDLNFLHVNAFYRLQRQFVLAQPWVHVPEKQTFRIRMDSAGTGMCKDEPLVIWAKIGGNDMINMRKAAMAAGQDFNQIPLQRTLTIFYKRYDAEQRTLGERPTRMKPNGGPAPAAELNPLDMICAGCGKSLEEAGVEVMSRCAGCRDVYYCSKGCQTNHWTDHKTYCAANKPPEFMNTPQPGVRPGYWPARENVLLWHFQHEMPTGDLELFDSLRCVAHNPNDYPFPMTFRKGANDRPRAAELGWLMRALAALTAFIRDRPESVEDMRPMRYEHTMDLTLGATSTIAKDSGPRGVGAANSTNSAAIQKADGASAGAGATATPSTAASSSSAAVDPSEQRVVINPREQPWYDVTGDIPIVHIRTDPLLSKTEAAELKKEIEAMRAHHWDPNAYKPGAFVPSRTDATAEAFFAAKNQIGVSNAAGGAAASAASSSATSGDDAEEDEE